MSIIDDELIAANTLADKAMMAEFAKAIDMIRRASDEFNKTVMENSMAAGVKRQALLENIERLHEGRLEVGEEGRAIGEVVTTNMLAGTATTADGQVTETDG